jgi:hypothetical protein
VGVVDGGVGDGEQRQCWWWCADVVVTGGVDTLEVASCSDGLVHMMEITH